MIKIIFIKKMIKIISGELLIILWKDKILILIKEEEIILKKIYVILELEMSLISFNNLSEIEWKIAFKSKSVLLSWKTNFFLIKIRDRTYLMLNEKYLSKSALNMWSAGEEYILNILEEAEKKKKKKKLSLKKRLNWISKDLLYIRMRYVNEEYLRLLTILVEEEFEIRKKKKKFCEICVLSK